MNRVIQTNCTRCNYPMRIEFDPEWMKEDSVRKIATCDRCMRRQGFWVPKKETQNPNQIEMKMPYTDL